MLSTIAATVAPLFICASIGYVWGRLDRPFEARMVTALSVNIGVPCLIFSTLTRVEVAWDAFARIVGAYGVYAVLALGAAALLLRLSRLPQTVFLPSLAFGNTGNMGLPLCLFAFGEAGLAFALSLFVVSSIVSLTLGHAIYAGRLTVGTVARNPLVYAILAAGLVRAAGMPVPGWLVNTTQLLGGMGIPLMILSLGVSISKLRFVGVWRTAALGAARLGIGLAAGLVAVEALDVTGLARAVVILQCAMPAAVNNYLFAQRFDRRPDEVAGVIVLSTLFALAGLPALLWALL